MFINNLLGSTMESNVNNNEINNTRQMKIVLDDMNKVLLSTNTHQESDIGKENNNYKLKENFQQILKNNWWSKFIYRINNKKENYKEVIKYSIKNSINQARMNSANDLEQKEQKQTNEVKQIEQTQPRANKSISYSDLLKLGLKKIPLEDITNKSKNQRVSLQGSSNFIQNSLDRNTVNKKESINKAEPISIDKLNNNNSTQINLDLGQLESLKGFDINILIRHIKNGYKIQQDNQEYIKDQMNIINSLLNEIEQNKIAQYSNQNPQQSNQQSSQVHWSKAIWKSQLQNPINTLEILKENYQQVSDLKKNKVFIY